LIHCSNIPLRREQRSAWWRGRRKRRAHYH